MNVLSCQTDSRRDDVRKNPDWNGLDYVEVDDLQTTITVFFLGKAPEGITRDHFQITGGRSKKDEARILSIDVQRAEETFLDDRVLVHVDKPGDYSTYTLSLVGLEKVDSRYSSLEFSFKAGCPTGLDCAPSCGCEPEMLSQPVTDYLAKDYSSFRQLILDRLSLICPGWRERHVPDLGIALVELFAYVGDYLSYYQDAAATEAYIDTARRRPSVRRHAKLVDYSLSEGCNARALIAVKTHRNLHCKTADVFFITGINSSPPPSAADKAALRTQDLQGVEAGAYEVFQPVTTDQEIHIWQPNNKLRIYTWGRRECCILKGATHATLWGRLADTLLPDDQKDDYNESPVAGTASSSVVRLKPGDFLIFEELVGPVTGLPGDADPKHRQAVRLTSTRQSTDELLNTPIIEIEWCEEDALRFDLCISAVGGAPECRYFEDISVAWGNVILVDHGRSAGPDNLGSVPTKTSGACCECEGHLSETTTMPGRYRPKLHSSPLTFAAPISTTDCVTRIFQSDPRKALPVVTLTSPEGEWKPRADLLSSDGEDRYFVVEMEEDGEANIRFGDGELGHRPDAGSAFTASYRIGNGTPGNVGAGAIRALVHRDSDLSNDIKRVWNPLPAQGGADHEPMEEAKLTAPSAFRFGAEALQRAITADDYARIAERHSRIQRAAAQLTWIGSWYEADVGVDVKAAYASQTGSIGDAIEAYLEDFRRIGHDLDVRPAEYVPIDLALKVCIAPEYLKGHVKAALLDAFSNRALRGGALGFFHPDRLTFGRDIYLSAIIAAAQAIPGVISVHVTRLQRQMEAANQEIELGVLPLGPYAIAQLDNDRNHPDHGRLEIVVVGGR